MRKVVLKTLGKYVQTFKLIVGEVARRIEQMGVVSLWLMRCPKGLKG